MGTSRCKTLHLSNDILRANGGCHVFEQFVEDGNLIRWTCFYGSKGELVLSEWNCFSIGDKGVLRTMIWKLPEYNIKITNNKRTFRRYIVLDAASQSPPRSIPAVPHSRPVLSSPVLGRRPSSPRKTKLTDHDLFVQSTSNTISEQ